MKIFLFIDALGWDLVGASGYLADILPHRREVTMQFGYSCSAIPTILSGRRPDEHGHLGLFEYAPDRSPFRRVAAFMRLLRPRSLWNRGRVRGWLSRFVKRALGFTGYFQLYQMPFRKLALMDYCEKRDLFAPRGMEGIANLYDVLEASGRPFHISDWHIGDRRNFAAARRAIAEGKTFLFIYTAELDALLHQYPVLLHDAIREKLEWYYGEINSLFECCRERGGNMRLTVISDHGMTPLSGTADLKSAIEKTGLVFGRDYGACYDSTMLRVSFLTPEAEPAIRAALAPFADRGRWLTEEEEKHYGIYRADRRFGDAIFLMAPGVQIVPSDMGLRPLNGMHGFAPEDRDSQAVIMSTEEIPTEVRRVADYFGLMQRRLAEA